LPAFDRKSETLTGAVQAQVDARQLQPSALDAVYEQYGGVTNNRIVKDRIVNSRSQAQTITTDNTNRRLEILGQINNLIASGDGWAKQKKQLQSEATAFEKSGDREMAKNIRLDIADMDKRIGTPQSRQVKINALSMAYKNQPSAGQDILSTAAAQLSGSSVKLQELNSQFGTRSFEDIVQSEGRNVIAQYQSLQETIGSEIALLDSAISQLEIDFKTETNPLRKQKISDDLATAQLRKTAKLNDYRNINKQGAAAAIKVTSDRRIAEEIAVDRTSADFYEQQNPGSFVAAVEIDKSRFGAGKRELELQKENGQLSAERYNLELQKLTYNTDTYRKSIEALRPAATGFFSDMFTSSNLLEGIGNAFTNFFANIAKQMEQMI
jgi:hypothetical protein